MAKLIRSLFLGVALLALIAACLAAALLAEIRHPASDSAEQVELLVDPGASTSTIATSLSAAGLIRQPLLFTLLVRWQGLDGRLQAGRYLLRHDMTVPQVIAALQNSRVEEVQLRVIEGLRLEEVAETVAAAGLAKVDARSFTRAARNAAAFKADHFYLNALPPGASLEGYLFPDTYRIAATATVTEVITTMLNNFDAQYKSIERTVSVPDVKVHQVVTMASIVQREAADQAEMPRIAAVFWNRLKPENEAEVGGKLGADPTVQYVLGSTSGLSGVWWPKLDTLSLDEINGLASPYNTRVNPGLPPGPIASPGLAALKAAAQPTANTNELYFVAACGKPGSHNFAATFAEFQEFEQAYLNCPK